MRKEKSHAALLIKATLLDNYRLNKFTKARGAEQIKAYSYVAAIGVSVAVVLGMICVYFWFLGKALLDTGKLDALLSLSAFAGSVACLFMSIYKSPGYLFSFRDFDLLASLPVKDGSVLASKVFALYLSNAFFAIGLTLPGFVIYGILSSAGVLYYVFAAVFAALVPVIPMLVGAAVAFLIMRFSSKAKKSNLLALILSFGALVAFMVAVNLLQRVDMSQVGDAFVAVDNIVRAYFPAAWLAEALARGNAVYGALSVLLPAAALALFLSVFARSFKSVNAALSERFSKSDYRLGALKVSSPLAALYKKEMRFYFSSFIYVLNTATGVVLMTVFVVALLFIDYEAVAQLMQLPELPNLASAIGAMCAAVMVFCVALTCTTSSAVSLEGKQLPILKSLPVRFSDIAKAKLLWNMTITVPFVIIDVILAAIALKLSFISAVSMFLPILAYCALTPLIGLYVNLRLPKLGWKSHVQVVKQSASVSVTLLLAMLSVFAPIIALVVLRNVAIDAFLLAVFVFIGAVSCWLWQTIKTKGKAHFDSINE